MKRRTWLATGSSTLLGLCSGCVSFNQSTDSAPGTPKSKTARESSEAKETAEEEKASGTGRDASEPVTVDFFSPSNLIEESIVLVAPDAQWEHLRQATGATSSITSVFDTYPAYDYYALGRNSTSRFPQKELKNVRIDGNAYNFSGQVVPAAAQQYWYERTGGEDSEAVNIDSLNDNKELIKKVIEENATSLSEAVVASLPVPTKYRINKLKVIVDGETIEMSARYVSSPEWPPNDLYVKYRLRDSTVQSGGPEMRPAPYSDEELNKLLQQEEAPVGALTDDNVYLLTLSSLWSINS